MAFCLVKEYIGHERNVKAADDARRLNNLDIATTVSCGAITKLYVTQEELSSAREILGKPSSRGRLKQAPKREKRAKRGRPSMFDEDRNLNPWDLLPPNQGRKLPKRSKS